jgi:hypothetical protein
LNPGAGKIFFTHPEQPLGPPSLRYNGYWVSFLGGMAARAWLVHPPPSCAKVKGRVELYLYSPSGTSWPVLRVKFTIYIFIFFTYKKSSTRQIYMNTIKK